MSVSHPALPTPFVPARFARLAGALSLLTVSIGGVSSARAGGSSTDWSYPEGSSWGTTCEAPTAQQSPIDFTGITTTASTMTAQQLWVPSFVASDQNVIFDNGLRLTPALGGTVPVTYDPTTLHFHASSEHILSNNTQEPLEVHIKGTYGGSTVVFAALFRRGGSSNDPGTAFVQKGLNALNQQASINPSIVLGMFETGGFYAYTGSLTTPPCSTPVNFYVLSTVIPVDGSTLDSFIAALQKAGMPANNFRTPKPLLSGTTVYLRAPVQPPAAPTGVKVGSTTPTSIQLTYSAVPGATQYVAQWTIKGGTVPQLCTPTTGTTSTCPGLSPNTTYDLQVKASNAAGTSGASATVTARTP